jgi:serine/threonine protein kinase
MLLRIEQMHKKNFIHRDIKPENFLIGISKKIDRIYVIDFGLSKRYICPKTNEHISSKRTKFIGTPRYSSLWAHLGNEQSRRDDLEAIGNVLIYFYRNGFLPWMTAENSKKKDERERALELAIAHEQTTLQELLKGCPEWLVNYFNYVRNLEYEQKPDYNYMKNIFQDELKAKKFNPVDETWEWDWEVQREKIIKMKI